MSLLRAKASSAENRPSLLVQLRLRDKHNDPVEMSDAWEALVNAFKDHPYLEVYQAEIAPDKDEQTKI